MKSIYPWCNRKINDKLKELKTLKDTQKVFTQLFDIENYQQVVHGKLNGAVISIKDNLDVKGYETKAGSKVLGGKVASKDSIAVSRLKEEGAIILGHNQMTEFAYSGIGYNPHFGTPDNPLYPGCIPGGSTSGGAVSVALGMSDVAIGTDTGGSLRIPAAFCGLVGFKPSQSSIPLDGCLPLSSSLDSIGPIAKNVATCEAIWKVLSKVDSEGGSQNDSINIVIPSNFVFNDIDEQVKNLFEKAISNLKIDKVRITKQRLDLLDKYQKLAVWQFSSVESRRYYSDIIVQKGNELDPRVLSRILKSDSVKDDDFIETKMLRQELISEFESLNNTMLLMPTVVILPPKFKDIELDTDFDKLNLLCLRNTTIANILNGCSISIPVTYGDVTIGLMLIAKNGEDERLLRLAKRLEYLLK